MMKLRAQAAVEYLMILAVVIIIALVVVGVLGGFPTLSAGINEKESLAYWTSSDIGIVRGVISGTDSKMVLRNNKNFPITLGVVTVGGTAGTSLGTTLQPGETTNLVTVSAKVCSSGTYSNTVSIGYTDATYGTAYTFTGAKPLVGTCV
jgi:hypothetical protein